MNACTIVARNYLAQARVLADSFQAHHPDGQFSVLVLDDEEGAVGPGEPFEVIRPYEIGLTRREFHDMAMIYTVLELSTAVKPWLLRTLIDRGTPDAAYFDPDIQIFTPLEGLAALAREHAIVLTPHATTPIPEDGMGTDHRSILLAGTFNLGFIAVSEDARGFLDWWAERLERDCRVSLAEGMFVDQRFIDQVPALFDHYVVKDPGINVAYWNLHYRRLTSKDAGYEVNGQPLHFFHFSGFDPEKPWILSKFQGGRPRILLSEQPDVARICRDYAAALSQRGYRRASSTRYLFNRLPNGVRIDGRMRLMHREALGITEMDDAFTRRLLSPPPDPFDWSAPDGLLSWLNEPIDETGVSRYLLHLRRDRPLSQLAFPDLAGDAAHYLDWVVDEGYELEKLPPEVVPDRTSLEQEPTDGSPRQFAEGVNVVGYLTAEVGVGEAARQMITSLEEAGIPFSTVVTRDTPNRQRHPFLGTTEKAPPYDVNLICVNADRLEQFRRTVGRVFFDGRYSIGMWWWELARFPERMHQSLAFVDEIWVGSEFTRNGLVMETSKPVIKMPLPLSLPPVPNRSRSDLGLPNGFLFLFSFDFCSLFKRKNPVAVIEAFKQAFEPGSGPKLLIKSINGHLALVELEELRYAASGRDDILLWDGYLDAEEKNGLMASCDCYVSLHRSEGFGLTIAEAMAYGKPAIATAYGGNMEFMRTENCYLVPYRLTEVGKDAEPYPEDYEWADPDIEEAARLMRRVVADPEEATTVATAGQRTIRERHSPQRTAEAIKARLVEIRRDRGSMPEEQPPLPEPVTAPAGGLQRAVSWVEHGPSNSWSAVSGFGGVGRLARRGLRRLLRPYESRQREFEIAVVDALKEDRHRIAVLEESHRLDETATRERQTALLTAYVDVLERMMEWNGGSRSGDRLDDPDLLNQWLDDLRLVRTGLSLSDENADPHLSAIARRLDDLAGKLRQRSGITARI